MPSIWPLTINFKHTISSVTSLTNVLSQTQIEDLNLRLNQINSKEFSNSTHPEGHAPRGVEGLM